MMIAIHLEYVEKLKEEETLLKAWMKSKKRAFKFQPLKAFTDPLFSQ